MNEAIILTSILSVLGGAAVIAGGIAAIVSIYKYITDGHDRAQKWDDYDGKIKAIQEEQCMLTYCMMATLDGLHQLGCNGKVTEATEKLNKHLNQQAHGVK